MEGNKILKTPTLIASYPRSGSTYLRLLLTHALYPDHHHDLDSVNRNIPTIENSHEVLGGINNPKFYKTHELRNPSNVILLHRHVGDCLVSEFHYHKAYHGYEGEIEEFMEDVDYGKNWRDMIDHYYPCAQISFQELITDPVYVINRFFELTKTRPHNWLEAVEIAINKCNFDNLKKQDGTFFRSGKSGQWEELSAEIQANIIDKNAAHLKILGYEL